MPSRASSSSSPTAPTAKARRNPHSSPATQPAADSRWPPCSQPARQGVDQPNAAIGISAWTDLAITGESLQTRAKADPLITDKSMIHGMAAQYLGGADADNPLASPLYADYAGLPPLLLQVGDAEVLLSDTTRVTEKARVAGVDVVEEVWDEMFHVWHQFAPMLPEGQEAVNRIGEFINQHA